MSTPHEAVSDPHPSASFSSLPLELKSLIVKMCNAQDQAYEFRVLTDSVEGNELFEVLQENKWRGKSTNALSLVNSELSGLAAVHLFKVLPSLDVVSPLFRFIVLGRRSKLITTLDITSSDSTPDILSCASLLDNLDSIIVSQHAASQLFGSLHQNSFIDPSESSSVHQLHLSALSFLQHKIVNLTLANYHFRQATYILPFFSSLKYLQLEVVVDQDSPDSAEILKNLGLFIASSFIEHLSLPTSLKAFPSSWLEINWTRSHIRVLELAFTSFPAELFSFLGNFSATLEQLILTENSAAQGDKFQLVQPLRNLKKLSLTADKSTLLTLLELFSVSPVDSITLETMDYDGRHTTSWRTGLRLIIDRYKGLEKLEFIDRFDSHDFLPELVGHCQKQKIWLKFSQWQYLLEDIPIADTQQFKFRRSILAESFQLALVRLERLEEENDVSGLKDLYENCKWLRASAAEMKD